MAALLVAMSVMAIVLSTAMPVYQTVARREREAELVFRGEQYARAIALFQRKYGNQLPPDVDVLIDQRFLRKKYKDPITGGDFQYLGAGSPELAQAMSTTPQQALDAQRGRGAGGTGATGGRGTPIGAGFTRRLSRRTTAVTGAIDVRPRNATRRTRDAGRAQSVHGWRAGSECAGRRRHSCRRKQEHSDLDASVQRQEQIQRVALHGHSRFDPGRGTTGIRWANTWRPRGQSRWSRGRGSRPRQRYVNAGRGRARTGRVLADGRDEGTDLVPAEFVHHCIVQRRSYLPDRVIVRGWMHAIGQQNDIDRRIRINP